MLMVRVVYAITQQNRCKNADALSPLTLVDYDVILPLPMVFNNGI